MISKKSNESNKKTGPGTKKYGTNLYGTTSRAGGWHTVLTTDHLSSFVTTSRAGGWHTVLTTDHLSSFVTTSRAGGWHTVLTTDLLSSFVNCGK